MYTDISGYAPEWIKKVAIGVGIIVAVAAVSALIIATGGTGTAFLPAFATALKTGFIIAGISAGTSGTIRAGRSATMHIGQGSDLSTTLQGMGKSFLNGAADGFLAGAKYYAATSIAGIVGNGVSSKINFGQGTGYGLTIGSSMLGYQNPSVAGFTIFASTIGNKFRFEVDPLHSLHAHYGPSKSTRSVHRGYWIGGIVTGIYSGFTGEVY